MSEPRAGKRERAGVSLASDAARAIKRVRTTSSAPALITARRRSYFTPRSSIIHAVNNAPLFRVTLYRGGGGSPSFLPCPFPTFCGRERGWFKSLSPEGRLVRQGRSRRCVSGRDTLISRSIHQNGDTLRSDRSRRELAVRLAIYLTSSRERFPQDSRDERHVTSAPSFQLIDPTFASLIFTYFFNKVLYSHLDQIDYKFEQKILMINILNQAHNFL